MSKCKYKKLKALIVEKGMTQREFADNVLKITNTTLSNKMLGKRKFLLSEINICIDYFQKSYEEIFLNQ